MKNLLLFAIGVFLIGLTPIAHAQSIWPEQALVGFRSSGSQYDFEVNAGFFSTLRSYTTETLIGNFQTALTALSPAWTSATSGNAALYWGAAGNEGGIGPVYATSIWRSTVPGTLGRANSTYTWAGITGAQWEGIGLNATQGADNGFNNGIPTNGGRMVLSTNPDSWSSRAGTGTTALGFLSPNVNGFTGTVGAFVYTSQTNYMASDLYDIYPHFFPDVSLSDFVGTFALYTSSDGVHNVGDLTFTASQPAQIPEPSTYAALMGLAAAASVAIPRRRRE